MPVRVVATATIGLAFRNIVDDLELHAFLALGRQAWITVLASRPRRSRKPDIMADAAYAVITRKSGECTGNFFVDEEVLGSQGLTDFGKYAPSPDAELLPDFFL